MNAETIRSHLRAVPFVPFRLHTSSGQHFVIRSPDRMMVTNRTMALIDPRTDDIALVSNLHVTAIVPLGPTEERS